MSARGPLRLLGVLALAASAWATAHGLSTHYPGRFPAVAAPPWDAEARADVASDADLLWLHPADAFARYRDAFARAQGADGPAFRAAAEGVLLRARVRPGRLNALGRVALERWKARGEAEDRRLGEALLREFMRRAPDGGGLAPATWLEVMGPSEDPVPVFGSLPAPLAANAGMGFLYANPAAAWSLLQPALAQEDPPQPTIHFGVGLAVQLGGSERLAVLRRLEARGVARGAQRDELRAAIATLSAGRR